MWVIAARNTAGTFQLKRNIYRDSVRIGRSADNELQLDGEGVSRHHARIDVSNGKLVFRDLGSTNGSIVARRRVRDPITLDVGATIQIADYLLTIEPDPEQAWPTRVTVEPDQEPDTTPIEPIDRHLEWPSPVELLQTVATGIRQTRHAESSADDARHQRFEKEWLQLLIAAEALRKHLAGDRRVAYVEIASDRREVSAKIADPRKNGGFAYLILRRGHPDNPDLDRNDAVWLREIGAEDHRYPEPREGMDAFARSIGRHLALTPSPG